MSVVAAPPSAPILSLDAVEVVYKRAITAVQGISMEVHEGQIVAILGTNGAGKTTILRAISGFLGLDDARVTEGRILFNGGRIENARPDHVARAGLALVPEREKVFPNLTVAENLVIPVSNASAAERREREAFVMGCFPRLARLSARTAGLLSGGERQMLAIAAALMAHPKVLLIDELSLGLAPVVVGELAETIARIRRDLGLTIVLVEQSAPVALGIADYGYVIENGRVVLDGTADRLRDHPDIKDFYLGQTRGDRRSYRDVKQYRRSRRWYG
jgi:branched-chain amino acid transport system ATP-binding protein